MADRWFWGIVSHGWIVSVQVEIVSLVIIPEPLVEGDGLVLRLLLGHTLPEAEGDDAVPPLASPLAVFDDDPIGLERIGEPVELGSHAPPGLGPVAGARPSSLLVRIESSADAVPLYGCPSRFWSRSRMAATTGSSEAMLSESSLASM